MSLGVRNAEIIPFEPEQDNTCAREVLTRELTFICVLLLTVC